MNTLLKQDVIISIDVETTGESPCTSSCVMIGLAVMRNIDPNSNIENLILEKKSWCIKEITNRPPSDRCWNEFWLKNISVWNHIKNNAVEVEIVMKDFADFYADLLSKYNCKFVAAPASFDWQWIKCIYDEFGPKNKIDLPFSIECYSSIKRLAIQLGLERKFIDQLTTHQDFPHTHFAHDDAVEQGYAYLQLVYWLKNNVNFKNK